MKIDYSKTGYEISAEMKAKALAANALLHSGEGKGNDFLGWVKLLVDRRRAADGY